MRVIEAIEELKKFPEHYDVTDVFGNSLDVVIRAETGIMNNAKVELDFDPTFNTFKNIEGNLFEQEHECVCITTNGYLKSNGCSVMGKGVARQALDKIPNLDKMLGSLIELKGNNVFNIFENDGGQKLVNFPVKPTRIVMESEDQIVGHMKHKFSVGDIVPGWAVKAVPEIIWRSATQLVKHADENGYHEILLPKPGCGAGELEWSMVREILEPIFDDRFYIIDL